MENLDKAIQIVGGVGALAEKLGVKQPVVSNWKMRGSIPPNWCIPIEAATDGQVTRSQLRPDIYPQAA